jgi:hypothetical protein
VLETMVMAVQPMVLPQVQIQAVAVAVLKQQALRSQVVVAVQELLLSVTQALRERKAEL